LNSANFMHYIPPDMTQHPLMDQALLIIQTLRSHSDTPRLVGLLWTSDRPDAETLTRQHTTLTRNRHGGIRTGKPGKRRAADPRLRPRGHYPILTEVTRNPTHFESFWHTTNLRKSVTTHNFGIFELLV